MKSYKLISLSLAAVFVIVGCLFLFLPDGVIIFFNRLSRPLGMREAPRVGFQFYLGLAAGYMYLVSVLAWLMFKRPGERAYPFLLAHGKTATSLLSLGLFVFHEPYLLYLANFLVDGLIGTGVLLLFWKTKANPT